MKNWKVLSAALLLLAQVVWAQPPQNWFNLDLEKDGLPGVSTERAYEELVKDEGKTIVVAIIDSGSDIGHEDLKDKLWVNEGETPGNGIDDDGNGYVDDVHGWNFIGGPDGKHVNLDTYEATRLYRKYYGRYENAKLDDLSSKEKEEYALFKKAKDYHNAKRKEMRQYRMSINMISKSLERSLEVLEKHFGKDDFTRDEVLAVDLKAEGVDSDLKDAVGFVKLMTADGSSIDDLKGIKRSKERIESTLEYSLNPDFNPRWRVGDNYEDAKEQYYGNSDPYGPKDAAEHGTHVAGLVGAARNNSIGMDGVASNVKLMIIRCVPNGDERDKDVANAIRYAVDNGAHIVNMSFGKAFSPYKDVVDDAVAHAAKNDVLLVHAAGNDNLNTDVKPFYPNRKYENGKLAPNWLEIGASSPTLDENLPATFSNYGKEGVDVFSPGVQIYSTMPEDKYANLQGTSMAAPIAAGVAALVLSQNPELSAEQLKQVLCESAVVHDIEVVVPGGAGKKSFKELSRTGAIINAYEALKMAEKIEGKRKGRNAIK